MVNSSVDLALPLTLPLQHKFGNSIAKPPGQTGTVAPCILSKEPVGPDQRGFRSCLFSRRNHTSCCRYYSSTALSILFFCSTNDDLIEGSIQRCTNDHRIRGVAVKARANVCANVWKHAEIVRQSFLISSPN